MVRNLLATSALIALSASGVYAQGETTATQPAIVETQQDDASARLPTAGTANPADLMSNTTGSASSSTQNTDNPSGSVPEITRDNSDDVPAR